MIVREAVQELVKEGFLEGEPSVESSVAPPDGRGGSKADDRTRSLIEAKALEWAITEDVESDLEKATRISPNSKGEGRRPDYRAKRAFPRSA